MRAEPIFFIIPNNVPYKPKPVKAARRYQNTPPLTGNVEFWPGFYVQVQILGGQINLWGINGTP